MKHCDFFIVGAGIAGASVAWHLCAEASVVIAERENLPGYHTTGRSAALLFDSYGGPAIRRLTQASRAFFEMPPDGFSDLPLLSPRGAMFVARKEQVTALKAHISTVADSTPNIRLLSADEVQAMVPIFKPGYVALGAHEPDAMDMDVAAIHQGFLRGARRNGAELLLDEPVIGLSRNPTDNRWQIQTRTQRLSAAVVINAAGAWVDEIARLAGAAPIGIVPKRRTVIVVPSPPEMDCSTWPLTADIEEQFYFKPDAGRLWLSPADETPMAPCDVQPDELDIAVLVERISRATTLEIRRIEHRWAGLRSFVSDNNLVIGPDHETPGFFWLAAQGGYGIQTSPAAGRLAASLALGRAVPTDMTEFGLSEHDFDARRLGRRHA